ncbi:MAG: hypothetical protein Q7U99_04825 [Rubrivivax sp.]|nr:hypothetical protein [Rubrivivax sp.]
MSAAPAVSVQGSGGNAWRLLQSGLPAVSAAALVAWGLGHWQLPLWPAWTTLPVMAFVAWRGLRPRAIHLSWDGQIWQADGQPGPVEVMVDLGPWLLLRLKPVAPASGKTSASVWIPLAASEAGPALHALRAAVYCPAPEPTPGARMARPGPHAAQPD